MCHSTPLQNNLLRGNQPMDYVSLMLSGDKRRSSYHSRLFPTPQFVVDQLIWKNRNDPSVCWYLLRKWPWKYYNAFRQSWYSLHCTMYTGNNGFIEAILDGEEKLFIHANDKSDDPQDSDDLSHELFCFDLFIASGFPGSSWRDTIPTHVFEFLNNTSTRSLFAGIDCDAFALSGILGREFAVVGSSTSTTTSTDAYKVPHIDTKENICGWTNSSSVLQVIGTGFTFSTDVRVRVRNFMGCDDNGNDNSNDNSNDDPIYSPSQCIYIFTHHLYPQHLPVPWSDFHHAPLSQLIAHVARSISDDVSNSNWSSYAICDVYVVSAITLSNARTDTTIITDQDFLLFNPVCGCDQSNSHDRSCGKGGVNRGIDGYLPGSSNMNSFIRQYLVIAKLTNRVSLILFRTRSQHIDTYSLFFFVSFLFLFSFLLLLFSCSVWYPCLYNLSRRR